MTSTFGGHTSTHSTHPLHVSTSIVTVAARRIPASNTPCPRASTHVLTPPVSGGTRRVSGRRGGFRGDLSTPRRGVHWVAATSAAGGEREPRSPPRRPETRTATHRRDPDGTDARDRRERTRRQQSLPPA